MKIRRKCCWLLLWDHTRTFSREEFEHLKLPRFVGALPSKLSPRSLKQILPSILLSHAPIAAASKVDCGKNFRTGHPKTEECKDFPSDTITCTFGRLILVARLVRNLEVVQNNDLTETITWVEERRYWPDPDEPFAAGREITPERSRSLTFPLVSKVMV